MVRAAAAARPAVAGAAVQLRAAAVAVAERGAQLEAVQAADAPRLEAAVEASGAPQEAEVEPRGALPWEAAVEAADVPRLQAAVEAQGAPREAEVEPLGARVEAEEAKLGALPQPELKLGLPGARLMATLMVGPAVVSVGQSPARRLALAAAVGRAVPAAVLHVVLTIVPAPSQRLQHLASVVRMGLSSALREAVGLAVVPMGSAESLERVSETGSGS